MVKLFIIIYILIEVKTSEVGQDNIPVLRRWVLILFKTSFL